MTAVLAPRRVLLALAVLSGAGVFALFLAFERPGLGLGHAFYLSIGLAALALGAVGGAIAGGVATALFTIGILLNDSLPSQEAIGVSTSIRLVTFVAAGALLGWYGSRNRHLTRELTFALDELRVLAARDEQTGLGNTRAFEDAVTRRLADGRPFALLLASVSTPTDVAEAARDLALRLPRHLPAEADVTRVGTDTFAVLLSCGDRDEAGLLAGRVQRALATGPAEVTIGWATTFGDGETPLSLYRAAEERLYVRRMVLASRPGPPSLAAV